MALKDIIKALESEHDKKVQELTEVTDKKLTEIKNQYQTKLALEKKRILENTTAQVKRRHDMELFAVKSDLRAQILSAKRELLDKVFAGSVKKLSSLSDNEYIDLIKKLLKILPSDTGVIIPTTGKESLVKKAIANLKAGFKLAESPVKASGGFVWQGKDINVDLTFEKLVEDMRAKTEIEVSEKLFS